MAQAPTFIKTTTRASSTAQTFQVPRFRSLTTAEIHQKEINHLNNEISFLTETLKDATLIIEDHQNMLSTSKSCLKTITDEHIITIKENFDLIDEIKALKIRLLESEIELVDRSRKRSRPFF